MPTPETEEPQPFVCFRPGCLGTDLEERTLPREREVGFFMLWCRDCETYQNHAGREEDWATFGHVIQDLNETESRFDYDKDKERWA